MEKTIDLSKLFDEHFIHDCDEVHDAKNEIVEFAKEAISQALELAAENVELTDFASEFLQEGAEEAINKQSILNTINQIE